MPATRQGAKRATSETAARCQRFGRRAATHFFPTAVLLRYGEFSLKVLVPISDLKPSEFFLSPRQRALLAVALLSLGPWHLVSRAQTPVAVDPASLNDRVQAGDPDAINALANAFANGAGVPENLAEAVRLYELAAARVMLRRCSISA
jgi:TPR repeat protein